MRKWIALALLAGGLLSGCAAMDPGPPPSSIEPLDQSRKTAVEVSLKHDPELAGCPIKVTCQNYMVTLDGSVPNDAAKDRAEKLARSVEGVQKVANHLTVTNEGALPTP